MKNNFRISVREILKNEDEILMMQQIIKLSKLYKICYDSNNYKIAQTLHTIILEMILHNSITIKEAKQIIKILNTK